MRDCLTRLVRLGVAILLAGATAARAQDKPAFTEEQLDQMLAPIALYPDSLLSQVFMASTYPADVAEAAKWSKANPNEKGDEAVKKVGDKSWDPSVQSLVAFPQVLAMMSEKPEWVQNVGDAFLAAPSAVMDRVQFLRKKAHDSGNLKSTEQQNIIVEQPAPQETIIKIEPAQPQVVYVPTYNPTVVYGSWWWPSYPPYYFPPPPGYAFGSAIVAGIGFGIGIAITDSLWGDCNWGHGHGDVDINVNKYNNINVNNKIDASNNKWNHNSNNRKGTPYRDSATGNKYAKSGPGNVGGANGVANRRDYRGRDADRAQASQTLQQRGLSAPAANNQQALSSARNTSQDLQNNPQARQQVERAGQGGGENRGGNAATARSDNALSGVGNANQSHQAAQRGNASRGGGSGGVSRPSGGGGGGASRPAGGGGGGRRR